MTLQDGNGLACLKQLHSIVQLSCPKPDYSRITRCRPQAWLGGEGQEVLPLGEAARIDALYDITRALEFLASQGYVHGALRPAWGPG